MKRFKSKITNALWCGLMFSLGSSIYYLINGENFILESFGFGSLGYWFGAKEYESS